MHFSPLCTVRDTNLFDFSVFTDRSLMDNKVVPCFFMDVGSVHEVSSADISLLSPSLWVQRPQAVPFYLREPDHDIERGMKCMIQLESDLTQMLPVLVVEVKSYR